MEKPIHINRLGICAIAGLALVLLPINVSGTHGGELSPLSSNNSELIHSAVFVALTAAFTLWSKVRGKRH